MSDDARSPEPTSTCGAQFDQYATDYQAILDQNFRPFGEGAAYFAEHKALYLRRALGAAFAGRLLDYGCGIGLVATAVRSAFPSADVHAFDPSSRSVETARATPEAERIVFHSDERELAASYDVALLANVLHHVDPAERVPLLRRLGTRLRPGGRLVVFEHNALNPAAVWSTRRSPFDRGVFLLRRSEVVARGRAAGFDVERSDFVLFFPRPLAFLRRWEPRLAWCPLGLQHATILRRP